MAWNNQRVLLSNVPRSICYRIIRSGMSAEHIADLLACNSIEDLLELNWLAEKPFGKISDNVPMIKSAITFKSWDSTGTISTSPYNINSNYVRFSTATKNGDTYNDAVLTGNATASVDGAVRWGWSIEDTNFNACTISTANDIGNNHSFIFINNLGINPRLKKIDESGTISILNNNFTFTSELTEGTPTIHIENEHDGKREDGSYNPTINYILGGSFIQSYNYGIHDGFYDNSFSGFIFENSADLDYYLKTGDSSRAINGEGEKPEEKEKNWYINCKIKKCDDSVKSNSVAFQEHKSNFYYVDGVDESGKYDKTRPIAGYVIKNMTSPYNIEMVSNPDSEFIRGHHNDGVVEGDTENFDNMPNPSWTWTTPQLFEPYYYYGIIGTNIPIFATREDCFKYFRGEIDKNSSLNPGGKFPGKDTDIGAKKQASIINSQILASPHCHALYGGLFNLEALISVLYTDDTQEMDAIKEGLALNGEMPLSFIIDCYETPFDISPFLTGLSTSQVHFGTYLAHLNLPLTQALTSVPVDMFSVYFSPTYNDFRDYLTNYYLYLPYCGITSIDTEQYLYHTMSCKVCFDIYTGTLKYYLLCDGIVANTYEANVRISMPLYGTDNYASAMTKIDAVSSIANGVTGAIAQGGINPFAIPQQIVGTMELATQSAITLNKATPKQQSGNVSSSVAVHDEMTAYLIIEQPEIEYGDNIVNQYGLPDNRVGIIGNNSGFIACDDVVLVGCEDCNETEKNQIKSMLQSGIYV